MATYLVCDSPGNCIETDATTFLNQLQTDSGLVLGYDPDAVTAAESMASVLQTLVATSTTEEIQLAFIAGFSLPVICYLVAWGYQTVINFALRD